MSELLLEGSILFLLANIGPVLVAQAVAWRLKLQNPAQNVAITTIVYATLVYGVVLILGLTGALTISSAIVISIALSVAAALWHQRWPRGRIPTVPNSGAEEPRKTSEIILTGLTSGLFAGAVCLYVVPLVFGPSVLLWDDLSYHSAIVADWLTRGEIRITPFNYQVYYPKGPELISAWYILPFSDDTYVSISSLLWMSVLISSLAVVLQAAGLSRQAVLILCILCLSASPIIRNFQGFSVNDLAGTAATLAAVACFAISQERHHDIPAWPLLSGAAIGLAVSAKVFYVVPAVLLLIWWYLSVRSINPSRCIRFLALFFLTAAIVGGYWYLRNLLETGNPIYPAEFGPFAGPFDATSQTFTKALTRFQNENFQLWKIRHLLAWPDELFVLSALAGIATLHLILSTRADTDRTVRILYAYLLALMIVTIIVLPLLPFSGSVNRPYATTQFRSRFTLLAVVLGVAMCASLWRYTFSRILVIVVTSMTSIAALRWLLLKMESDTVVVAAVVAVAVATILIGLRYFEPPTILERIMPTADKALVVALISISLVSVTGKAHKADITQDLLFQYGSGRYPIGSAWEVVDRLPPGSRIGFYMAEPHMYTQMYPIFGRFLQHIGVALDDDGTLLKPVHERKADFENGWWADWTETPDGWVRFDPKINTERFAENLRKSGIDYVLLTRWSMGLWPPQARLLRRSDEAMLVFRSDNSVLWKIGRKKS